MAADFEKDGARQTRRRAIVNSTANVLLTRRLIERWQDDWFRAEFAEIGGSDTEFFWRTARAGHRHAIAVDALVYEDIPASRARPAWLLRRFYRKGSAAAHIRVIQHGRFRATMRETANFVGLLLLALVDIVRAPTSARSRLAAQLKLARAAGKLAGLSGFPFREYAPSRYRNGG